MKVDYCYCDSLLGVGNGIFNFKHGKQSTGPEKRFFKVCFFLNRHLDTQILEFFPLLLAWSYYYYYFFFCFWSIIYGLTWKSGPRIPYSIVCICVIQWRKEQISVASYIQTLCPLRGLCLPAFVLWNSAHLLFLELFLGCLQSWHYSLQKGRNLALFHIPPAFSSEPGKLLVFVIQQILDWLSGSPKELGVLLGFLLLLSVQVLYVASV